MGFFCPGLREMRYRQKSKLGNHYIMGLSRIKHKKDLEMPNFKKCQAELFEVWGFFLVVDAGLASEYEF